MTEEDAAALIPHVAAANALPKFTMLLVPKTLSSAAFTALYKQVVAKAKKKAAAKK